MLQVSTKFGGRRFPQGLNITWSAADHASVTTLRIAKTARCTPAVRTVTPRVVVYCRARRLMKGVASAMAARAPARLGRAVATSDADLPYA